MFTSFRVLGLLTGIAWLGAAGCSAVSTPQGPTPLTSDSPAAMQVADLETHAVHPQRKPEDKGYIDGWFEGEDIQLYYTKSFFCAPLSPTAPTPCELGAPPVEAPRPGQMRTIYAIAAAPAIAGLVDPETLSCRAGTPCLNHPLMIDASRIGGSPTAGPAAHNHIPSARGGGWFHTVNIRVFSLEAWEQIAAAKTLAKVRELQGNPSTGRPDVISGDTATNIYFFIASWR
jgi:hypothetical protein